MNVRQRSFPVNLNRVLILVLTLSGLLMDGLQFADLPCTVALVVWLWLPPCTRAEAHLLRWAGGKRGSVSWPNAGAGCAVSGDHRQPRAFYGPVSARQGSCCLTDNSDPVVEGD